MLRIYVGKISRDSLRCEAEYRDSFIARISWLSKLGLDSGILELIENAPEGQNVPLLEIELEDEDAALFSIAAQAHDAERQAGLLIARAEQCRFGLNLKLGKRGYDRRAVKLALDRLEELGLLSDQRFARAWLGMRIRMKAEGPETLIAGLLSRGIDRDLARSLVIELYDDETRQKALSRAISSASRSARFNPERLRSKLLSQGFKHSELDAAFNAIDLNT